MEKVYKELIESLRRKAAQARSMAESYTDQVKNAEKNAARKLNEANDIDNVIHRITILMKGE